MKQKIKIIEYFRQNNQNPKKKLIGYTRKEERDL